jgi:hypothetical protein
MASAEIDSGARNSDYCPLRMSSWLFITLNRAEPARQSWQTRPRSAVLRNGGKRSSASSAVAAPPALRWSGCALK